MTIALLDAHSILQTAKAVFFLVRHGRIKAYEVFAYNKKSL